MKNRVSGMATIGLLFIVLGLIGECHGALQAGYYTKKCISTTTTITPAKLIGLPATTTTKKTQENVEAIVKAAMVAAVKKDPTLVAAFLRMQFHDCFVKVPAFANLIRVMRLHLRTNW